MTARPIRIGLVGAGGNMRARHIPGLRALKAVEIHGVVNSTPHSTNRAADEFGIPQTYPDWEALIDDSGIDAVVIGTWPNLHCEITCAALEAGKHVLTEARMARNAAEAHRMLEAAHQHPDLVKQIVPSPYGLVQQPYLRGLLDKGFLGEFRELVVLDVDDTVWDTTRPLHWRQNVEISGLNILALGILHETAMRWAPAVERVFAQMTTFNRTFRTADDSETAEATVPDSVQAVAQLEGGGRGLYHLGGVNLFGPGRQIHLYGSKGTIRYEITPRERLLIGQAGDAELRDVDIPPEQRGCWRVEEEFIGAIRGDRTVHLTDFATGVKYMEFTEAVTRSAATNQPVNLPLES